MREKEIKKLIQIVEESTISELEVSRWGRKVRIRKNSATQRRHHVPTDVTEIHVSAPKESKEAPSLTEAATTLIVCPMVGTFYRAPAPNTAPFVEIHDTVKPGQTVGIVEAMKLMNEIESEVEGRIVKILVENGQPVEYNQPLFVLEPIGKQ
jgi:acetyl-CoA carboxylase biotin carboxyl carrier protein